MRTTRRRVLAYLSALPFVPIVAKAIAREQTQLPSVPVPAKTNVEGLDPGITMRVSARF